MKRLLLALTLFLLPSLAVAQCNGVFPNNTACGNITGSSNLPRPVPLNSFPANAPGGTTNQIQYNAGSGLFGGFTFAGDCTVSIPNITCTKTSGVPFTSTATTATGTSGATIGLLNANKTDSGNNAYSGTNIYSGAVYFGNGKPWADVRSGSNGCAAAAGNNSNDDTSAIQCQATYMYNTYSGGIVYVPPGNYKVTSTITLKGGVTLVGSSVTGTSISANADFTVLAFDTTVARGGLRDISIAGSQTTSATTSVVTVGANALAIFRDCGIFGGSAALTTAGVDGYMDNCTVFATATSGTNIVSTGANWYQRVKSDTGGFTISNSFVQNTCFQAPSSCENHFVMSDFSGSFSTASININDAYTITVITNSVLNSPIQIAAAEVTILTSNEFGSTTLVANSVGPLLMNANYGLSAITASGTASRTCAGNVNLTC